ncbi:GNAT family N-acetyltransferase [Aurantiacibacter spongiae]|uniref:N-acetyltransferase n=1 Tax=Aurantiacibacter spongiae TaxID=2488860 RepID=A0A3N5DQC5_9SPHN|nr:GNAT family N-acetyltransferase [Aurantiacibacter spongiae]RPF71371.1 N-acetyltransferase [Aurantiacibacter spongiae]
MAEFRRETPRLTLRDWRKEDWPRFWEVTNTPAVMRWLGGVADDATRAGARERLQGYARDHGHTFWVVERHEDGGHLAGELLGFCGLKRSNAEGERVEGMVEIGWRLRREAWGHGYAREAAEASLDEGFARFGADEIIALTVEGNIASRTLMRRLGLTRRPELDYTDPRHGPDLNPVWVHSITRDRWGQRAP